MMISNSSWKLAIRSLTGVAACWKPSCQLCGSVVGGDCAKANGADAKANSRLNAATRSALAADLADFIPRTPCSLAFRLGSADGQPCGIGLAGCIGERSCLAG